MKVARTGRTRYGIPTWYIPYFVRRPREAMAMVEAEVRIECLQMILSRTGEYRRR